MFTFASWVIFPINSFIWVSWVMLMPLPSWPAEELALELEFCCTFSEVEQAIAITTKPNWKIV